MKKLITLLLAWVSVSSWAINLTDTDVSIVWSALWNAWVSLVEVIIKFAPYLIWMAVAIFIFNWISSHTKLHKTDHK